MKSAREVAGKLELIANQLFKRVGVVRAGKIWREHGALEYMECVADDLQTLEGAVVSFPEAVKLQDDEVVVFAFIVYPSREDRDRINEKVMNDPRMGKPEYMPFDFNRMMWGGFRGLVDK